MKILSKKSISLVVIFTLLMAIFMPTIAHAEERPVASITRDSKVYLVDIKKDGVFDLKYIYSSDLTNSEEIFDGLREAFSGDFATLIPTEITNGNTTGIMNSTKFADEMDSTWSDFNNVISKYYSGDVTDVVESSYYDVENKYKSAVDTEREDIENNIDFLEDQYYVTGTEIVFPIGSHYDWVYKKVGGQVNKVRTNVIDYERVTVYYKSANVITNSTQQAGHNNIWTTSGGQVAVLYENRESEQSALDGNHYVDNGHVVGWRFINS